MRLPRLRLDDTTLFKSGLSQPVHSATLMHALGRLRAQTLHVRVIEAHDLSSQRAAHASADSTRQHGAPARLSSPPRAE